MSNAQPTFTRTEVRQIGRIIANMTHDMKNVLGVVRTSMGLLADIQAMGKKGLKHADTAAKALEKMDRQSAKGVELSTHTNNFAHAMDRETSSFDLHHLAEDVARLMERLAAQQEMTLRAVASGPSPTVEADRIRLFLALSLLVDACLAAGPAQAQLTLTAHGGGGGVLRVAMSPGGGASAPELTSAVPEEARDAWQALGWSLAGEDGGDGPVLSLTLPAV